VVVGEEGEEDDDEEEDKEEEEEEEEDGDGTELSGRRGGRTGEPGCLLAMCASYCAWPSKDILQSSHHDLIRVHPAVGEGEESFE